MKKITLLAVALIIFSSGLLNAQTNQGNLILGVSSTFSLAETETGPDLMGIGFSSIKYKSDSFEESDPNKTTSINLLPKVGYFLADNFAVGIDMNVASLSTKDKEYDYSFSQTQFSIGPFLRYYIPTSKVFPFFEISGSLGSFNSKYDYGGNVDKYTSSILSYGGGIGLAAPLGERVMFDVLAGYNSLTIKAKENNPDNERIIFGTLGLKIGFTILLGSN